MAVKFGIYKCMICGNIAEVLNAGDGDLVCCGESMKKLIAKTEDEGQEKHVPVIEKNGDSIKVKIGSVPHPMEEKHHIEWIELRADDKVYKQFLKAGQKPEAVFNIRADSISAREHCNVHGLWKSE